MPFGTEGEVDMPFLNELDELSRVGVYWRLAEAVEGDCGVLGLSWSAAVRGASSCA